MTWQQDRFTKHVLRVILASLAFGILAGIYFRNPIAGMICFFGAGMIGVYSSVLLD